MIRSMPSSSMLSSASVTRQAISIRASRSMSSPVISQSIHTSLAFTVTAYDLGFPPSRARPLIIRTNRGARPLNPVRPPASVRYGPRVPGEDDDPARSAAAESSALVAPDVLGRGYARPQRGVRLGLAEPHGHRHHARPHVGGMVLRLVRRPVRPDLDRGLGQRQRQDGGGGQLLPGGL